MSTKAEVLKMLERISDDEPLWLLRGQDLLARNAMREWLIKAAYHGVNPDKLIAAAQTAAAMDRYPGVKAPDSVR